MLLADLSWTQVRARAASAILAVPLGSTEQHGPHLPLSTDTDIAVALCETLVAGHPEVLIAPAVPYGSSGEHADFAGTLSIGQDALEHMVVELVRSAGDTFARVVLVSAHGGNAAPLARAITRLRQEGRSVLAYAPGWDGDPHAGRTETSLMRALRPHLVDMERAVCGNTRCLDELLPALRAGGVRAVSATGVLGDPSGASAAHGREILAELGRVLLAEVTAWLAALP